MHTVVGVLKREKKNAKSTLTRMLNQLAASISEENYDKRSVAETIERLEKLRDEVMRILEELETVYSKLQDEENEKKTSKEIEVRVIILTHVSSLCRERNVSREKKNTCIVYVKPSEAEVINERVIEFNEKKEEWLIHQSICIH